MWQAALDRGPIAYPTPACKRSRFYVDGVRARRWSENI
jgi:hypothetical protein